jgi:hypothetical protein
MKLPLHFALVEMICPTIDQIIHMVVAAWQSVYKSFPGAPSFDTYQLGNISLLWTWNRAWYSSFPLLLPHVEIVATILKLVWHLWVHVEYNRSNNQPMAGHGQRQVPTKCFNDAISYGILWGYLDCKEQVDLQR